MSKITLFLLLIGVFGQLSAQNISIKKYEYVGTGANQSYQYLPMLAGKRIGDYEIGRASCRERV